VQAEVFLDRVLDDLGAVHRRRDTDGFGHARPVGDARVVGQDVAPVHADHGIVVFEEELVLVVAEHHHDVGVDLSEGILQVVQALLDAVVLLDEDFLVNLPVDARVGHSQQLVVADVRAVDGSDQFTIAFIVFSPLGPVLPGQAHQRRVGRSEACNDFGHSEPPPCYCPMASLPLCPSDRLRMLGGACQYKPLPTGRGCSG
jgi:phosphotransferase system IIA component